ncbi:MAG: hypothetical protein LWX70_14860 [Sphingobacteriia bacterium]|nr:hypothetical protein [Sphingobacteriia bacterium]
MNVILNNPYRTVGLLVGSTAREQTRQINRLKKFIEADEEPQDDFSFPVLGGLHRTLDNVEEATSKLNLDSDKINTALFWFWNGNPITDEAAFDALKGGDIETANEIWDKLIARTDEEGKRFWKPVTEKNYSAFHNCSILNIIRTNGNLHYGIVANLYFLESDLVQKFVSSVADETHKTDKKELQLSFLNQLYSEIEANTKSSLPKFLEILNKQEFIAKQDFMKGIVQKPIEQIEQKIEASKSKRKSSKSDAANAGQELFTTTASDLSQLKSIVGANDLKYTSVADKVANEILQCSIDFFNESNEKDSSSDYAETAMRLAKQAETLAIGKLTKDRIKDGIETLEEMKDMALSQAIQLLETVKEAYETNEREIRAEVKQMEETDIQIILGNRSINWSAVEDNIKNSINWEEVNKLLVAILPDNNLKKIKESDKSEEKKEFLKLANWLKEKSKMASTINAIIDKYKKIPPKLPFKILSSTITNTNKTHNPLPATNPLYKKHTRYVGLKIDVECNENSSITIYKKYINPSGKYSSNDNISPKGYTSSTTAIISPFTKAIDLLGWGNSDSCVFEIGKHRIELYIDEYLIYATEFIIDLAPSEKLEIELHKAVSKLTEIRNSEFFKSDLEKAEIEMNEIEKFQLFRSSSTKQFQISEQERKISIIKQKAETEKKQQLEKQNKIIEKLKSDLQDTVY